MIIDTIKLIASDLADMSPKTQLEIVKLCKNLCIAVKDYLVENDENIETINTYIENLQTAVSNLNTSITDLSGELTTAEGNIQANANAILTIQDAIGTIESTLNNVYTKTQIDTMLASIYTKSEVDTLLLDYYKKAETYSKNEVDTKLSLYYTMIQVNELLSGKLNASDVCFLTIENRYTPVSVEDFNKMYASKLGVIFYNGYKYYYTGATTLNDIITLNFNSYVVEDGVTKVMALSSDTRLISPIDADVAQSILVSGTNIKTINGQSILGSGDLPVGGSKLYQHNITITNNTTNTRVNICIITTTQTAFTYSTFADYLYNKLGSNSVMCCGIANGADVNAICKSVKGNSNSTLTFGTVDGNTFTPTSTYALFDNIFAIN